MKYANEQFYTLLTSFLCLNKYMDNEMHTTWQKQPKYKKKL